MCAAAGRHERPCRRSPQSGPEEGIWPPLPRIPHGNQFLRPETHLGSPGRLPLVWRLRGDLRPQHLLQQGLQPPPCEGVVSEPGCQAHEGSWLPQEPERSRGWRSLGRSRDLRDGAPPTQLSQEKLRPAGGKGLALVTVSPATSLKARALLHMAATCPWPPGGPLSTGLQPSKTPHCFWAVEPTDHAHLTTSWLSWHLSCKSIKGNLINTDGRG